MKKDYYELKDIIFGLSDAYQDNRSNLNSLKKYIEINKNIKDYDFYLNLTSTNDVSVMINYYKKAKLFERLFNKDTDYSNSVEVTKTDSGFIKIDDNITIIDQYSFASVYDYIINCQFTRYISLQNISSCDDVLENTPILFINPSNIIFDTTKIGNDIKSMIYYNPITNQLEAYYIPNTNTPNLNFVLKYLLSTRFAKNSFNDFHKEYIEEYLDKKYYIEFNDGKITSDEEKISKKLIYDVFKEDNQIILSRRKK